MGKDPPPLEKDQWLARPTRSGQGQIPKAPLLPRIESGSPPDTEVVGTVPSIKPVIIDDSMAVATRAQDMAQAAMRAVKQLEDRFEGQAAGIEAQIQTTVASTVKSAVASEMGDIKAHLNRQDVAAAERDGNLIEALGLLRDRDERDRKKLRDSLTDATAHAQLANIQATTKGTEATTEETKTKERWAWLEHYKGLASLLWFFFVLTVALGAAAGVSQCERAKAAVGAPAHE